MALSDNGKSARKRIPGYKIREMFLIGTLVLAVGCGISQAYDSRHEWRTYRFISERFGEASSRTYRQLAFRQERRRYLLELLRGEEAERTCFSPRKRIELRIGIPADCLLLIFLRDEDLRWQSRRTMPSGILRIEEYWHFGETGGPLFYVYVMNGHIAAWDEVEWASDPTPYREAALRRCWPLDSHSIPESTRHQSIPASVD